MVCRGWLGWRYWLEAPYLDWVYTWTPCRSQDGRKAFSDGLGGANLVDHHSLGLNGYLVAHKRCKITKFFSFHFLYELGSAFRPEFAHGISKKYWGPKRLRLENLAQLSLKLTDMEISSKCPQTYLLAWDLPFIFQARPTCSHEGRREKPGQVEVIPRKRTSIGTKHWVKTL